MVWEKKKGVHEMLCSNECAKKHVMCILRCALSILIPDWCLEIVPS